MLQRSYYYSKVMAHLSATEEEASPLPIPSLPILQLYHSMLANGVHTDRLLLNTLIYAMGEALQTLRERFTSKYPQFFVGTLQPRWADSNGCPRFVFCFSIWHNFSVRSPQGRIPQVPI